MNRQCAPVPCLVWCEGVSGSTLHTSISNPAPRSEDWGAQPAQLQPPRLPSLTRLTLAGSQAVMQPTHPRPSAAYVASLRRQQPPKPQGMCREPFPWNSTWPSSDSSASLMPKHATELRLVTNEDFFAVGQGPWGGTARCGPAGPCPCRFLANDLGTLCCSAPMPICCCARNLMGCLAYNCCCGVSRGVFTGLPEAAPCNPCCCFPCQCCSRQVLLLLQLDDGLSRV